MCVRLLVCSFSFYKNFVDLQGHRKRASSHSTIMCSISIVFFLFIVLSIRYIQLCTVRMQRDTLMITATGGGVMS